MFRFMGIEVWSVVFLIWLLSLASSDNIPVPISVSPTKQFDGIDGNWSTFALRVGNPPQNFRVLATTLVPESWVVLTQGCTSNSPSNCQDSRGELFVKEASKTWVDQKTYSLGKETDLGYSDSIPGNYGFDTMGVTTPTGGVVLDHQIVAGIQTTDFYLGFLGLATWTPTVNNNTQAPFLTSLRDAKRIPSLSYGYTAGASYNSTLGSLTLGGYDSTRFVSNSVSFQFGPSDTQYLSVGIQSIQFTSGSDDPKELAQDGFYAMIDSTISQLWLPNETCQAFADAYGLTFNSLKLQYLISDDQHDKNVKNNPVASFKVGNLIQGGDTVTINFPYAAFDLYFLDPKVMSPTPYRYFPLRQGTGPKQYVLGRTFLQEAFLTVDYERKNFTLAQALSATDSSTPTLEAIISPTDAAGSSTSGGAAPASTNISVVSSGSSFPSGAIAGIVIGVIVIAAGIFAIVCLRRRKQRRSVHSDTGKQPKEGGSEDAEKGEFYGKEAVPPSYSEGDPSQAKPGKGPTEQITELPSPPGPNNDGTFSPLLANRASTPVAPYELAGTTPRPHEMDSRHISMASSGGATLRAGSALGTASATGGGAIAEEPSSSAAGADAGPTADLPTPASGSEWIHDQSYFDPNSPSSRSIVSRATSLGLNPVAGGSARIVSTRSPRSPTSPRSGPLRRQGSGGSHSTLVDDSSGRGSPAPPDSAFQSPQLRPGAFPRTGSVSPIPGRHSRTVSDDSHPGLPALTP